MTTTARVLACAGLAGAAALALTMHVFMLAGGTLAGGMHDHDGLAAPSTAAPTDHGRAPSPQGNDHAHTTIGCASLLTLVVTWVLAGIRRRTEIGAIARQPAHRAWPGPGHHARPPHPPAALVDRAVLLRV